MSPRLRAADLDAGEREQLADDRLGLDGAGRDADGRQDALEQAAEGGGEGRARTIPRGGVFHEAPLFPRSHASYKRIRSPQRPRPRPPRSRNRRASGAAWRSSHGRLGARARASGPRTVGGAVSAGYRRPRLCEWTSSMNTFKADIEEIRRRAMEKMDEGAVTAFYKADQAKVIEVLNEVLATETVCTLRYRNHYFMANGHPLLGGRGRVPRARQRGAAARGPGRQADHRARRNAEPRPRGARDPQPRPVRHGWERSTR